MSKWKTEILGQKFSFQTERFLALSIYCNKNLNSKFLLKWSQKICLFLLFRDEKKQKHIWTNEKNPDTFSFQKIFRVRLFSNLHLTNHIKVGHSLCRQFLGKLMQPFVLFIFIEHECLRAGIHSFLGQFFCCLFSHWGIRLISLFLTFSKIWQSKGVDVCFTTTFNYKQFVIISYGSTSFLQHCLFLSS